jgi:hypothetical protein
MRSIDPQVRKAAKALGFERDLCEHCHGKGHLGRPGRPCICTGGQLYYPQRVENGTSARPLHFGKTDEQVLELWARTPSSKRE